MPFHPVPLTVEVKLIGEHEGDPRITTLHYRYAATGFRPTADNLRLLIDNFLTNVFAPLASCVVPATVWHTCTATDINDDHSATFSRTLIGPYVGTRTGQTSAGNVQVAIAKHVGVRHRGATGRIFVMDTHRDDIQNSIIQNALSTLLNLLLVALLRMLTDGTNNYIPVVASKKHTSFSPILSVSYDSLSDELITRLKGHRKHRKRAITT